MLLKLTFIRLSGFSILEKIFDIKAFYFRRLGVLYIYRVLSERCPQTVAFSFTRSRPPARLFESSPLTVGSISATAADDRPSQVSEILEQAKSSQFKNKLKIEVSVYRHDDLGGKG